MERLNQFIINYGQRKFAKLIFAISMISYFLVYLCRYIVSERINELWTLSPYLGSFLMAFANFILFKIVQDDVKNRLILCKISLFLYLINFVLFIFNSFFIVFFVLLIFGEIITSMIYFVKNKNKNK